MIDGFFSLWYDKDQFFGNLDISPIMLEEERLMAARIWNFGSLNIDYVYAVEHMVRPGETVSSLHMERFCGGKGLNQSIALARAGAAVSHVGCIGGDGMVLRQALKDSGVDVEHVRELPCPTGHAIIQVDRDGQNAILLFPGANRELHTDMVEQVLSHTRPGDFLLLQNEVSSLEHIIRNGKAAGLTVAFNPSPADESLLNLPLELVDCFLLNEIEGAYLSGETQPEVILDALHRRFPGARIVLTLGGDGCLYHDGQDRYYQPVVPARTVDTTAAGDTFTGYFLAGWMEGVSARDTLLQAATASSIAVSRKGASPSIPTRQEVERRLTEG